MRDWSAWNFDLAQINGCCGRGGQATNTQTAAAAGQPECEIWFKIPDYQLGRCVLCYCLDIWAWAAQLSNRRQARQPASKSSRKLTRNMIQGRRHILDVSNIPPIFFHLLDWTHYVLLGGVLSYNNWQRSGGSPIKFVYSCLRELVYSRVCQLCFIIMKNRVGVLTSARTRVLMSTRTLWDCP